MQTSNVRSLEEELGQLREEKARQDVQLVDLGEKLRHAERIVRESTEDSENAVERASAELDSTVQELRERETEVRENAITVSDDQA